MSDPKQPITAPPADASDGTEDSPLGVELDEIEITGLDALGTPGKAKSSVQTKETDKPDSPETSPKNTNDVGTDAVDELDEWEELSAGDLEFLPPPSLSNNTPPPTSASSSKALPKKEQKKEPGEPRITLTSPLAFVVLVDAKNPQVHFMHETPLSVGREKTCGLTLDNATVSRKHANLEADDTQVWVTDLKSGNGTRVNQHSVQRHALSVNDRISFGRIDVMFLGPVANSPKWNGVPITALPFHDNQQGQWFAESTFRLSDSLLSNMRKVRSKLNRAQIIRDTDGHKWTLGVQTVTFGVQGDIPIRGAFVKGLIAELHWNGAAHVLTKLRGGRGKLMVNRLAAQQHTLQSEDQIQVGNQHFTYRIEAPS